MKTVLQVTPVMIQRAFKIVMLVLINIKMTVQESVFSSSKIAPVDLKITEKQNVSYYQKLVLLVILPITNLTIIVLLVMMVTEMMVKLVH